MEMGSTVQRPRQVTFASEVETFYVDPSRLTYPGVLQQTPTVRTRDFYFIFYRFFLSFNGAHLRFLLP